MTITVQRNSSPIAPPIISSLSAVDVILYPNPADDHFTMRFTNFKGDAKVKIVNINGMLIVDQPITVTDADVKIKLPDVKPGIYFVNIISNKDVITRKLVIEQKYR